MICKAYVLKSQVVLLINTIMYGLILILMVNNKPELVKSVMLPRLYLFCDE